MWKHTTHHPLLNKSEHSENQWDVRPNDGHTLEAVPLGVASWNSHMNSGGSKHSEQRGRCRDTRLNLWEATRLGQRQGQGEIWYPSYWTQSSFPTLLWSCIGSFHAPVLLGSQAVVGNEKGNPQGWNLTGSHCRWKLPVSWKGESCHHSQPLRDFSPPQGAFTALLSSPN